jgi:hypothetical protein
MERSRPARAACGGAEIHAPWSRTRTYADTGPAIHVYHGVPTGRSKQQSLCSRAYGCAQHCHRNLQGVGSITDCRAYMNNAPRTASQPAGSARARTSRCRSGTRARRPAGIYAPALLHRITHACVRAGGRAPAGPAQHAGGLSRTNSSTLIFHPNKAHPPSPSYVRAPMPRCAVPGGGRGTRTTRCTYAGRAGTRGDRARSPGARRPSQRPPRPPVRRQPRAARSCPPPPIPPIPARAARGWAGRREQTPASLAAGGGAVVVGFDRHRARPPIPRRTRGHRCLLARRSSSGWSGSSWPIWATFVYLCVSRVDPPIALLFLSRKQPDRAHNPPP